VPEALEKCKAKSVGVWVTLAVLAMSAFQVLLGH